VQTQSKLINPSNDVSFTLATQQGVQLVLCSRIG